MQAILIKYSAYHADRGLPRGQEVHKVTQASENRGLKSSLDDGMITGRLIFKDR